MHSFFKTTKLGATKGNDTFFRILFREIFRLTFAKYPLNRKYAKHSQTNDKHICCSPVTPAVGRNHTIRLENQIPDLSLNSTKKIK